MADVFMPQLGETVADGTVTKWFKEVGDAVTRGEPLFEVSTDKVDTEIPAQADGVLSEILVSAGTTVDVGTRLAVIAGDATSATTATSTTSTTSTTSAEATGTPTTATAPPVGAPALAASTAAERLSPVVRRLLAENAMQASDVVGTG
ncbi:MAG: 2-oxoglutarate dehydrogenase, partial [Acidobacteria bacterium]|nr:2-oxoglutarate dehydrogenase [Acidobacteriota bacterium]